MTDAKYSTVYPMILGELNTALACVSDEEIDALIKIVTQAEKVFFVGVGRVLLSLEAIAKRWAHLGIEAHIVGEITEPAITEKDVLIVGSGSGTTMIPAGIAQKAHKLGAKVVHIGSNPNSGLKDICCLMVRIPVQTKNYLDDEINSQQPMTSLFEQSLLLLGDAVAKVLIERSNIDMKQLWRFHANLE